MPYASADDPAIRRSTTVPGDRASIAAPGEREVCSATLAKISLPRCHGAVEYSSVTTVPQWHGPALNPADRRLHRVRHLLKPSLSKRGCPLQMATTKPSPNISAAQAMCSLHKPCVVCPKHCNSALVPKWLVCISLVRRGLPMYMQHATRRMEMKGGETRRIYVSGDSL